MSNSRKKVTASIERGSPLGAHAKDLSLSSEAEMLKPQMLRPFILTCDKRLDVFKEFVKSYKKIASSMLQPVLIIDDSNKKVREEYHELLLELDPFATIAQPRYEKNNYNNIQYMMIKDFPQWALLFTEGDVIFMEDDIELSSKFPSALKKATMYLQKQSDFITFYSRGRYSTLEGRPSYDFMHPFSGDEYYGNICVLFNRRVLVDFKNNWEVLWKEYSPGWDVRWGQYMQRKKYRLYETKIHYANHLVGKSAISGKPKTERDETNFKK